MNEPALVLLISENPASVQTIREILSGAEACFSLQHIERVRTAAARIAGGGVSVVLVDVANSGDLFTALQAAAPGLPVIVLSEADDLPSEGAGSVISRPNWQRELKDRVLAVVSRGQTSAQRGTTITVLGAKGGVGATTVAVNVASVLASTAKVILTELRPAFGTLCNLFRPHRAARSLQHLLDMRRAEIDRADVESCLWPNRNIPGLSVLFAPDTATSLSDYGSDQLRAILRQLSALSEVVVVDLPPSLSDANRTILGASDTLALVVERDALSVDVAKAELSALEAAGLVPQDAGLVIVNRVPLAAPMALADIESQLGMPTFAVIPPAADLCAAAYRVHIPVVKLDAQSSMATSLVNSAKRFSGQPLSLCRLLEDSSYVLRSKHSQESFERTGLLFELRSLLPLG